jgi:hypothetical protein
MATRDGKQIAFEIETGKSDASANIQKCLSMGIEKVIVVATSAQARDTLLQILPKDGHITLWTATEVLTCPKM